MKANLRVLALSALVGACSKSSSSSSSAVASTVPSGSAASSAVSAGVASGAAAGGGAPMPRYEVKSGIVQMTNSMMDGMRQTLYFDEYGSKQATLTAMDMKVMGQAIHSENVAIDADGYHVDYDAVKRTGSRRKIGAGMPASRTRGASAIDVKALTDEMRKQMKVQDLPPKTIDGKVASGYGMDAMGMEVRTWTWKGLPLDTETDMGGKTIVVVAKSVLVDVPVPADKFVVPSDVKITDIGM